jgi:hypothetical protein
LMVRSLAQANFATVAPERKDTHHSVRVSLGSTVSTEIRAGDSSICGEAQVLCTICCDSSFFRRAPLFVGSNEISPTQRHSVTTLHVVSSRPLLLKAAPYKQTRGPCGWAGQGKLLILKRMPTPMQLFGAGRNPRCRQVVRSLAELRLGYCATCGWHDSRP